MDQPWSYFMHPETWLQSLDTCSSEEEEEMEPIVRPPQTPWHFGDSDAPPDPSILPHPEFWGEFLEEQSLAPHKILKVAEDLERLQAEDIEEEDQTPQAVPPPEYWVHCFAAEDVISDVDEEVDKEDFLDEVYQPSMLERYPWPAKKLTKVVKAPEPGNEWLSKEMHTGDAQLLFGASRHIEPKNPTLEPLKGDVVSRDAELLKSEITSNTPILLFEFPNKNCSRPFYGMTHRVVTYTTDAELNLPFGHKMVLRPGDTLPDVLNGTIQMRERDCITMFRSSVLNAPVVPVARPRDFVVVRAWRQGPFTAECGKRGLRVYSVSSAPNPASSSTSIVPTPMAARMGSRILGRGVVVEVNYSDSASDVKVLVQWDSQKLRKHVASELSVCEPVYQILPASNFYRVGLMEPTHPVSKRVPDYWKRRIHHTCVILNETVWSSGTGRKASAQADMKEIHKQGVIDMLGEIYPDQKQALLKQVWDAFAEKPYSINDLLKSSEKLTPEECVAAEHCERWKKYFKTLNIPQKAITMSIDKLKQLCDEIEAYERERVSFGEPFSMWTPRIKWLVEKLLAAPWHTSLCYQQVMESKNFFKIIPGDVQFVKVNAINPHSAFKDTRTAAEVDAALKHFRPRTEAWHTSEEKLASLQSLEEPAAINALRKRIQSKERSKLSAQEQTALYKFRMNQIYRQKLDQLKTYKTQQMDSTERDMLVNFEADLLAESDSESNSVKSDVKTQFEQEDYAELRKMMGIREEQQPMTHKPKKIRQLRVVQLEKDPNGQFVAREIYIYGDEIQKYFAYCKAHPEGGYIRAPLETDVVDGR